MSDVMLFSEGHLSAFLDHRREQLTDEVKKAPEDHVLQADQNAWAAALAEKYELHCPELEQENLYQDELRPVEVDVSHDHMRYFSPGTPPVVAGHRTVVHLPIKGERILFTLQASQYALAGGPRATVGRDDLQLEIEYPDDSPRNIAAEAKQWVQKIESHLSWTCTDVDQYNRGLEQLASQAIRTRREAVIRHREHVAATSLPTRKPDEDQQATYIADAIERRPAPPLPAMSLEQPLALEPRLSDEVFDGIIRTLHETAVGMARSRGTYTGMGEEDLRQVMLLPLNAQYRGQATAEAFNVDGKTDALIRWENANLFIGEFKKWSGESSLTGALDQVLGYQAWRDTKLAIVMFVENKDLSSVIEKSRTALEAHDRFVEWTECQEEDMLRAVINREGDEKRQADLAVLFVHIPQ